MQFYDCKSIFLNDVLVAVKYHAMVISKNTTAFLNEATLLKTNNLPFTRIIVPTNVFFPSLQNPFEKHNTST